MGKKYDRLNINSFRDMKMELRFLEHPLEVIDFAEAVPTQFNIHYSIALRAVTLRQAAQFVSFGNSALALITFTQYN